MLYLFELVVCLNFAQHFSSLVDSSQILHRKAQCVGVEITFVCRASLFGGQRSALGVSLSLSPLVFETDLELTDWLD